MPGPNDEKLIVQWSDRNLRLNTLCFCDHRRLEFEGTLTMNSSYVSKNVAFLDSVHHTGWNRCGSALLSIPDQNRKNMEEPS
jgi:hypothetical protein